jgi:multidrug efflux pump subunit AcrB
MPEPSAQAKDKGVIGLGVVITLVSIIGAFALGDYAINTVLAQSTSSDPFAKYDDLAGASDSAGSSIEQAEASPVTVAVDTLNVFQATFELTWTDEPDSARHTNQPDSFEIEITAPDGRTSKESGTNVQGASGTIEVIMSRNITKEVQENKAIKKKTQDPTWTGDWTINVTCTSAGDQTRNFVPVGPFSSQVDNGNAWELAVTWTYKGK